MSRRVDEESTEPRRVGTVQDVSQASLVPTQVRSSVSFLNPDISVGGTNLERAPSLNRLHAQSSTETSGLGETVTSGFSSQESVLSYLGDDKDRAGGGVSYVERSRRRPGGSPGSGRTFTEQELLHRDDNHRNHSGLAKQHISKQQRQQQNRLAIPGQQPTGVQVTSYQDQEQRREYHSQSPDHQQASSRRQKSTRDSGGRSLTPQQAKEELEDRQRKWKQIQQEREAALYISPRNIHTDLRPGSLAPSSENPRKTHTPSQKQKERDLFELSSIKEQHPGSATVRQHSSATNPSKVDPKFADHRPVYEHRPVYTSDRSERTSADTSKPTKKEVPSPATSLRPPAASSSRESIEVHSSVIPSSESKGSSDCTEAASANRSRSSSQIVSREREKRATSKSRDQLKSQSNSPKTNSDEYNESSGSRKSYETQILNRQSPHARSSSSGEFTEGGFVNPGRGSIESQRSDEKKKRRDHSTTCDVKKTLVKLSDSQLDSFSGKPPQTRWSKAEEGKSNKQQYPEIHTPRTRNNNRDQVDPEIHTPRTRNKNRDQVDPEIHTPRTRNNNRDQADVPPTNIHYRHRNEPGEARRSVKLLREAEPSKSLEKYQVAEELSRRHPQHDEHHQPEETNIRQVRRHDVRGNGRPDVHCVSEKVDFSDVRDIDLGPILIRGAAVSRVHETRSRDQRKPAGEDNLVDRSRDIRVVATGRSVAGSRSRDSSSSRIAQARHPLVDELSAKGKSERGSVPLLRPSTSHDDRASAHPVTSIQGAGVETMNYERLLHQASQDMNGTGGGGGSRAHPSSFTGRQPPSWSGLGDPSVHGPNYIARNSQVQSSEFFSGAVNISSPTGQDKSVPLTTSASYTPPQTSRPVPTVHLTSVEDPSLNIENVGREWERRDSRSSNRSGTSSRFLGVNTGSAWTKWSRERRASYRRRLEKMEQENPRTDTDVARISTPIKKARQEGLKFVHPDLEATYLSEDDINELRRHKQQQVQAMRVIERSRRHKFRLKNELKLTPEQWHLLQEFWNHAFFVRTRFLGIILSFITLIFMIVSITHHSWLKHSEWNSTVVEGLWINCTQSTVIPNSSQGCASSHGRNLQNAVIGLMIFAVTFGFLASVLSVCGVFTNPLPRKIYYFHSAGEICFICAISAIVALIVFPIAVVLDDSIHSVQYGLGYGLGWLGTIFFLAAAICMSLDDLVRESSRAKYCRWCWRSHPTDRSELRQV